MTDTSAIMALQRSVDSLTAEVSTMRSDLTKVKVSLATMSGRFTGGTAVIMFLGTFAVAFFSWILGRHA